MKGIKYNTKNDAGTANPVADGLVCQCWSNRGISFKLRPFHNQLKHPCTRSVHLSSLNFALKNQFCTCSFWWEIKRHIQTVLLPEASLSRFVFSVKSLLFQKRKTQQPPEQLGEIGIIRSFKSVSRAVNICRCSCLALNLASSKPLVHCLTLNYHISKTALTPCTDDEIFNDAWVSALHQPESCSSYCDVPWGPRLPDQRPSQQSLDLVSRKLAPGTHL